jgi:hypothetical protein
MRRLGLRADLLDASQRLGANSLGRTARACAAGGASTLAARLSQLDRLPGRGEAGCARRSIDEAPPRQVGPAGRMRREAEGAEEAERLNSDMARRPFM